MKINAQKGHFYGTFIFFHKGYISANFFSAALTMLLGRKNTKSNIIFLPLLFDYARSAALITDAKSAFD